MWDERTILRELRRYEGRAVTVQTYGLGRVFGVLTAVYPDCIRLSNTQQTSDLDDSRWSSEIARSAWEDSVARGPEAVILLNHLVAVTCDDDDLPADDDREEVQTAGEALHAMCPAGVILNGEGEDATDAVHADGASDALIVNPFRLELQLGARLISLVRTTSKKSLPDRIKSLRRELAAQIGFQFPPVRLCSQLILAPDEYVVAVNGSEVARGEVRTDRMLAILPQDHVVRNLHGEETLEPAFHLPAMWITEDQRRNAESVGCTVVDAASVLITHLGEILRDRRHTLLTHDAVVRMLQELRVTSAALVEENFPQRIPTHRLHRVLCELLSEGIDIAGFEAIVESVVWHGEPESTFDELYRQVRRHVGPQQDRPAIQNDSDSAHRPGLPERSNASEP